MPTAEGFIKSTSGGRFAATFNVGRTSYSTVGVFATGSPPFACNNATLSCTDMKQLSSTRVFEGKLGPNQITITFANGTTIRGDLDMPINPGTSISGNGVWSEISNVIVPDIEI